MEMSNAGLGAVFLLGLSFGAGPCNIVCLPYLGPVFLAGHDNARVAWRTVLPFSLGRLFGYALLGAGSGGFGFLIQNWLDSKWAGLVLGYATIIVALAFLFRYRRTSPKISGKLCTTSENTQRLTFQKKPARSLQPGLFFMGVGMAFNPCTPLTMVIAAAAMTASPVMGFMLGLAFGMGAVIIPAIIFAVVIVHISAEIRQGLAQWRRPLEMGAISMLLFMGTATALGWISP